MQIGRWLPVLGIVLFATLLCACAAGPNPALNTAMVGEHAPAGFWLGFWHGIISPVTFIISLFDSSVGIYEVHNNGNWYNLSICLGILTTVGGSSSSASRRRKPRF